MTGLIYNQQDIPREQYRYGFRASSQVGCGWIATHNALCLLGKRVDTQQLIRYYERLLPLIHGNAGTSFWAPAHLFAQWGYPVRLVYRRGDFDGAARNAQVCILFYRWRRKAVFGAHFVALHHTDGGFVGYNTYRNSTGPDCYGQSLDAFLKRQGYFGCVLTCIG